MRRFVVVLAIIGGIVFICAYSMLHARRVKEEVEAYTGAIFAAIDTADSDALSRMVGDFNAYWSREERFLVRFVRHAQIDEITQSVARLGSLALFENPAEIHAELNVILWKMDHIYQAERLTPGNIL